jgi:hypothetical protein
VREFPLEMTRTRAFCFWTNSRFLTGQGVVLLSPLSGWFSKNEHKELKKKVLLRLRHLLATCFSHARFCRNLSGSDVVIFS